MAEIRSTLEMVMERAERLTATANDTGSSESALHDGMRVGAAFMRGEEINPLETLKTIDASCQHLFKKGLVQTFLRNIVLPRVQDEPESDTAYNGLRTLAQQLPDGGAQVQDLMNELRSILSRYSQHRAQLKEQLEESFASQVAMLEQNLAQQTGIQTKLSPAQHPKFAEEWQKALANLNEQYENAIDQYKQALVQHLS